MESTYFKNLLQLGPTTYVRGSVTRQKLKQHILVMRALDHCFKWVEHVIFILKELSTLVDPEILTQVESIRKDILTKDKVQAKHVLAYRVTEVKTFWDLKVAIDRAIKVNTFTPIIKTPSNGSKYEERAARRLECCKISYFTA